MYLAATAAGLAAVGLVGLSCLRWYNTSCFYHRHQRSTIVITGASSGVGASLAKLLSKELPQSRLVLLARTESLLLSLKEDIEVTCRAGRCEVFPVDCSKGAEVGEVAFKVGRADIVVCAAGAGTFKAIFERDAGGEETARCLAAPLLATLNIAHAFLPPMLDSREGGVLLAVQSPASRTPWPGATAYTAARWGLRGVCAALRQDLALKNVRVCETILSEIKDSQYFAVNPGSKERVPTISPWFGEATCEEAAQGILRGLISGAELSFAPLRFRVAFAFMGVPGVEAVVLWLLRVTGWKGESPPGGYTQW